MNNMFDDRKPNLTTARAEKVLNLGHAQKPIHSSYNPFPRVRKQPSNQGAIRIVATGVKGVGKSALTVRFLTKRFIGEYGNEEDTKYRHRLKIDGEKTLLEILDMGSKNIFNEDILQWADGIILVYSITDKKSYDVLIDNVAKLDSARSLKPVPLAYMVVGSKADLLHQRKVTTEEGYPESSGHFHKLLLCDHVSRRIFLMGQALADKIGCSFFELSTSESPEEVDNVFVELCRETKMYKYRSRSSIFGRMFGGTTSKEKKTFTL